jgi:hypothetical protein
VPIHFSKVALEADHVIVFNRVKAHTDFAGELESGLHKMLMIGAGKRNGAEIYHRVIKGEYFAPVAERVVPRLLEKVPVLCGLAVVEDGHERTALVEAVRPEDLPGRERALLRTAKEWMPGLPVSEIDLLVIDKIGKEISGTGMDMNVVGRKYLRHFSSEKDAVRCRRIYVRGLSEKSKGNACGLGYADFTNDRTLASVNRQVTAINCVTSGHVSGASLPVSFPSDRECLETALQTIGLTPPEEARVIHIADTLRLGQLRISESLLAEVQRLPHVEMMGEPEPWSFDESGNLRDSLGE